MKPKIGIDLTYIVDEHATGIKKNGEEIVEGLVKSNKYDITLFVNKHLQEAYKEQFPNCKIVSIKFWFKNSKHGRLINIANKLDITKKSKIEKEKCNIIIYPYISNNTNIIKEQKKIISILDVIPLDEIEDKNSELYEKTKQKYIELMNLSEYITTLSEYSKNRLIDVNPSYQGKITVIPSSVAKLKKNDKKISEIINTEKPYMLTINSFFKHKNQITLIKAFNKIKEIIPHSLVLVGRPEENSPNSRYKEIVEYIEKNNLKERVKILSYISDEERNALLYNTDLFISTSYMEGFGRTPVEAAMCNVPVISTKETSLQEATMNEVFYYKKATSYEDLALKIIEVLNNRPTQERLEEISKKLTTEYSEEKIAEKYVELISEIMEGEVNAKN